jgi:hypothetical protein
MRGFLDEKECVFRGALMRPDGDERHAIEG